jgi:hypothetical protein
VDAGLQISSTLTAVQPRVYLGGLAHSVICGHRPKIGWQECHDWQSPTLSKKPRCARTGTEGETRFCHPTVRVDARLVHPTLMAWKQSRAISRRAQGDDLRRDIPAVSPITFVNLAALALLAPAPGAIPDAPVNNL